MRARPADLAVRPRARRWLGSVRMRLTLWSLGLLGVVLLAFSLFVYFRQERDVQASTITELQVLGAQMSGHFKSNHQALAQNGIAGVVDSLAQEQLKASSELVVALIDSQGHVSQRSKLLQAGDTAAMEKAWLSIQNNPKNLAFTQSITPLGLGAARDYYFILAPVPFPELGVSMIAIGLPADPGGQLSRLAWSLLTGSLALLAADLLIGYWLAGRILRPVQAITHAAREISETDLHRRLDLGKPDELGELADTFDQMLARLEAAFERQRQFTADASHELRTPLTIVDLETERALARPRQPEEYQRALGVIQAETDAMIRLVNDLLTLARLEPRLRPGAPAGSLERLDLSDVILEVVERLAPLALSRGARLVVGELPELKVLGDRHYLAQMMANLIENAIEHGVAECPQVRVEAGSRLEAGRTLAWLRITDNGPGIAPEHLPHLFDRFYRADTARAAHSGSGLGLAIVLQIVKAHDGQVSAHSSGVTGEGACFEVELPMATTTAPTNGL